jgi:peptidylprolyl isomerase
VSPRTQSDGGLSPSVTVGRAATKSIAREPLLTEGRRGAFAGRRFSLQHNVKEDEMSTENTLILETTKGPVTIEMRPDLAPQHVARIKELVREGFYDGIVFHRVIDGFMAQTGCPHGTGTGGSGKKLKAEFSREPHVRGVVSMARAQSPESGDSQFFICFDDATFLDGKYTVWGKVTAGMENVDKIKRGEPVANPDKIVKAHMAADAA